MVLLSDTSTLWFCKKQPQKTACKLCVRFSTLKRKKIENKIHENIYISSVAIKCQRYQLAMRKFPSRRVPEGGRGPGGDSACPDVTLLPRHVPCSARLSHVLSHLPSPTSKNSSVPKARCKGYMEQALWLKRQARDLHSFTSDTVPPRHARAVSGTCLVTALQPPTSSERKDIGPLPPVFLLHSTDYWVTRPARSGPR